jgi:tetratricopeptide (TPR) repeat protein
MAQPATNPKIEELRLRLKTDPKNRIFYPLAEELRKVGQFAEAEQVLRTGLTSHPTYLSAWVSLGRVSRELKNDGAAIEALNKALQLDPENVVAARLLADAYLSTGEKIEAIKKYKLVHALLPADEEVEATIERLDRELNPPALAAAESPFAQEPQDAGATPAAEVQESPFASETEPFESPLHEAASPEATTTPDAEAPFAPQSPAFGDETATFPGVRRTPKAEPPADVAATPPLAPIPEEPAGQLANPWATDEAHVFADAAQSTQQELRTEQAIHDGESMAAAHESPLAEPTSDSDAIFEVEAPQGMHDALPSPQAELVAREIAPTEAAASAASASVAEADVFASAAEPPVSAARVEPIPVAAGEAEITNTLTMADLYTRQGLIGEARQIYENILQRDPGNTVVRVKLAEISAPAVSKPPADDARVTKLEGWLARVGKREAGRV